MNHIAEEKNSEALALCTVIKDSIERLETACAGERKETREKLEAIESMVQECMVSKPPSRECLEQCQNDVAGKMSVPQSVAYLPPERRLNVSEALEWSIEPWSETVQEGRREHEVHIYPPNQGYFYGYLIRPFAVLKSWDGFHLKIGFEICRGECDKLLMWPMFKVLCLTVLHPTKCSNLESIIAYPEDEFQNYDFYMPVGRPRVPERWAGKISVEMLEESGYVKDDKILLRFEVLQCNRKR